MLESLSRGDLITLGRFMRKDIDFSGETNQNIVNILRGQFPDRSLRDCIRTLRKQGRIAPDVASENATAAGVTESELPKGKVSEALAKATSTIPDLFNQKVTFKSTLT